MNWTRTKIYRAPWTYQETISIWHDFIMGAPIDTICEMYGGRREELLNYIDNIIHGRESNDYAGSWTRDKWNPRRDRILLKMRAARLNWRTACRLLAFDTTRVRQRLAFLEGTTTVDMNDHLSLPREEWERFYIPQKPLGPEKKHRL